MNSRPVNHRPVNSHSVNSQPIHNPAIWIVTGIWAAVLILFIPVSSLSGLGLSYTLRSVSLGGALLGAISGGLGSFAVLRKQSLLGDALSHAALPGVGIAFLVAGRELWALLLGASAASFLGVGFISLVTRNSRIKQDGAMGIVLAGWFALGIGILTYIQQRPDASQAGLDSFIFGQAAAIVRKDIFLLFTVAAVLLVILLLFWKEFKLITFDPDFAAANGYPVKIITALLLSLIVIAVVMGLQLAGVVLMVGLLIAPGIAARQWTRRLEEMAVLGALIGASSGALGAILSSMDQNLPTGPMIIVVVSVFVGISFIFAPDRGLAWKAKRTAADAKESEDDGA